MHGHSMARQHLCNVSGELQASEVCLILLLQHIVCQACIAEGRCCAVAIMRHMPVTSVPEELQPLCRRALAAAIQG